MKKLISLIFGTFFITTAHTAQIANVEYIHSAIQNKHDITVPYSPELTDPTVAANMEYLLTAIDRANKILHGTPTSYAQTFYATLSATDTIAVDNAVETLIKPGPYTYNFKITTVDTATFSFNISAAGNFVINWGDGTIETITKTDTNNTTYTHPYATTASYKVKIGGLATAYNPDTKIAAISFSNNKSTAAISGSLGEIFPTLADGSQPSFYATFQSNSNLTSAIPARLFNGITGQPVSYMFADLFNSNTKMTGTIPDGLFAGLDGEPTDHLFYRTFSNCQKITGAIPENLFGNLHGNPAPYMFNTTFNNCYGLTEIPGNLFAKITGAPANNMFEKTFYQCKGITKIPDGLFASITGTPAVNMFAHTFYNCTAATGAIPGDLFAGISGQPAEKMFYYTFNGCAGINEIPGNLFAGLDGNPAPWMFDSTFYKTGITSIPAELFDGIYGTPARAMFSKTFSLCKSLKTVPENLFGNIYGTPAQQMFIGTFQNCTALASLPEKLFGKISGNLDSGSFTDMFNGCKALTGYSPKALTDDGYKFLYEIWPNATTAQANNTFAGDTLLTDYATMPTVWK